MLIWNMIVNMIILYVQYGQLVALQQQIQEKIDGQNAVDIGYWEALLQQLKAHMARARLRDRHQAMLRKKLFQLKVEVVCQTLGWSSDVSIFIVGGIIISCR